MEEVRFSLTQEDLWHFTLYSLARRRILFIVLLLLMLLILILLTLLPLILNIGPITSTTLFPAILVILFLALFLFRLRNSTFKAARGMVKRGATILGISALGISQQNELSTSTTSWRAIKSIAQDKHSLYLILDNPGSRVLMAMVIPRRAFPTPQDAEFFLARAQGYWQEQAGQSASVH